MGKFFFNISFIEYILLDIHQDLSDLGAVN